MPNFVLLDASCPDVASLIAAMLQARDAIEHRSWSHSQEPVSEAWWAEVLADPRTRIRTRRSGERTVKPTFYRLRDEQRDTILVACSKCDWKAAFRREELIASHGGDRLLPDLLYDLAQPGCARIGNQWDHCGAHYVEPIDEVKREAEEDRGKERWRWATHRE